MGSKKAKGNKDARRASKRGAIGKSEYLERLEPMQVELNNMARWLQHTGQRLLVVAVDGYAYLVPFVEEESSFFLKTVIPSRKATRDHLNQGKEDA